MVSCSQAPKNFITSKYDLNQVILDSIFIAENFNPSINYAPLSLFYRGNSIFHIGQSTSKLDSNLSFRPDPNYTYQNYFFVVKDYLSLDDSLSIELGNYSSINGIIFFSADQKHGRIFNVAGSWTLDLIDENMDPLAVKAISNKLFPVLKDKIKLENNWTYDIETPHQIEHWDVKKGEVLKKWLLNYEVQLK